MLGASVPTNSLEAVLQLHLEALAVKQYSQETIKTRQYQLRAFIRWCAVRGIEGPSDVIRTLLEQYQSYLFHYRKKNGQPLSFRTQHGMLAPLRSWFRWMSRENHVLDNPAVDLELPRLGHYLPKHVLSAEEAELLMHQPKLSEPIGLRDRAILETLYSTGIRRGECVRLKLNDTDFRNGTLFPASPDTRRPRLTPPELRPPSFACAPGCRRRNRR